MASLMKMPAWDGEHLRCVVESPRGSKGKFKYNPELKVFELSRQLILGVTYPYDWGFVPSTLAEDGDPLDVMMFHDVPTFPGVVMSCVPIGALLVTQKAREEGRARQNNHRVLAVPVGSERDQQWEDARELPERVRKELESFFIAAAMLADKALAIVDWVGPKEATQLVHEAEERFKTARKQHHQQHDQHPHQ